MAMFNYQCDENYQIIKDVSQNYPQLTTYEKEWLFFDRYGYLPGRPVELEYQTVQTDDTATVLNAIPHQYKSAILKGNTLVNLATPIEYKNIMYHGYCLVFNGSMLKSGKYTLKSSVDFSQYVINLVSIQKDTPSQYRRITISKNGVFTIHDTFFVVNTIKTEDFFICLRPIDGTESGTVPTNEIENCEVILLEGEHTNEDIPYFTGMQSVKMPVLTTSNEDGTKTNILTTSEEVELRGVGDVKDELNLLTGELTQRIGEVVLDGSENWRLNWGNSESYIGFQCDWPKIDNMVQASIDNSQISNLLPFTTYAALGGKDYEWFCLSHIGTINLKIAKSKLSSPDVVGLKTFLADTNLLIQYKMNTGVAKTVNLTSLLDKPFEGTNHYQVSSDTINPMFVAEVPIVSEGEQTLAEINQATYQNL